MTSYIYQKALDFSGIVSRVSDFVQTLSPTRQAEISFLAEKILQLEDENENIIHEYIGLVKNSNPDDTQAVANVTALILGTKGVATKEKNFCEALWSEFETLTAQNEHLKELRDEAEARIFELSLSSDIARATAKKTEALTPQIKALGAPPPLIRFDRKKFVAEIQSRVRQEFGAIVQEKNREILKLNQQNKETKALLIAKQKHILPGTDEYKQNQAEIAKLKELPSFSQFLKQATLDQKKTILSAVFYEVSLACKPATIKDNEWMQELTEAFMDDGTCKKEAGRAVKSEWAEFLRNPERYITERQAAKTPKKVSTEALRLQAEYKEAVGEYVQQVHALTKEQADELKAIPLGLYIDEMKKNALALLSEREASTDEVANVLSRPQKVLELALQKYAQNTLKKALELLAPNSGRSNLTLDVALKNVFPNLLGLLDLESKPKKLLDMLYVATLISHNMRDRGLSEEAIKMLTLQQVLDGFEQVKELVKPHFNETEWQTAQNEPEKLLTAYLEQRRDTSHIVSVPAERFQSLPHTISAQTYAKALTALQQGEKWPAVLQHALKETSRPSGDLLARLAKDIEALEEPEDAFGTFSLMQQLWLLEQLSSDRLDRAFVTEFTKSISSTTPKSAQKLYNYLLKYSSGNVSNPYKERYLGLLKQMRSDPAFAFYQDRL